MQEIPQIVIPEQFNAASAFLDAHLQAGRGARPAIYSQAAICTYAHLGELANRVGNGLRDLGVEMEQRVALLLLDSPAFAAAFFGSMKIGAVPVPINTALRPGDHAYMLNDCRAKVLLVSHEIWPSIQRILPELQYVRHIVVVGLARAEMVETATLHDFERWLERASGTLEAVRTHKDDSAFWLYSSGSTGFPKGCVHLHHDMVYCAEYYARGILGLREDDITFSAAKLYFSYGLGNSLSFPLRVGASTVHYPGRPLAEEMFRVIQHYRPTIFFGVPTLYANMLALPDAWTRFDFSSVRICVSAGEALPGEILRRWQDTFQVDILDGIGSTEALHIFISNRPGEIRPGSSGKVVPGYQARLTDEDGHTVPQGEIGNLLIRGDSIAAHYWNKHEKTKDTINGHWIRTGDKYYQDAEGYFWYAGRADDMLKVSGQWVSPVEVEAMLITHPAVLACAVVGALDAGALLKPKAYVVLNAGYHPAPELAETLKTFVKERLAPFKYPRWIEFVPELPMTATGKVQRALLRTQASEMRPVRQAKHPS